MSLTDKIQSLQNQVQSTYVRPPVEKMEKFISALAANPKAQKYLQGRNLTDETIEHFRLGYDSDKNAISIPIFKRGELINIKYRFLAPKRIKYTQEKDAEVWIYNEEGLIHDKKGSILIVEGEFDLMSCWQAGIPNVVSPASGKDSYGIWIELLDKIKKIYIAYDNDVGGKETAKIMADRFGVEKCKEILYPTDIKDANQYFKKHTLEDYKKMIKVARPFYSYQYKGMVDIISDLRNNKDPGIKLKHLPDVNIKKDWLIVVSGVTNIGKTSYVLNLAQELTDKDIPVLVLPFERGSDVVGQRFLQVKHDIADEEFSKLSDEKWDEIIKDCLHTPLYFAMPHKDETMDVIKKSKRIFDTKVVIIDHLDYMLRASRSKQEEIGNTLQALKRIAEENNIIMIVVTHLKKLDGAGSQTRKKPRLDDLKGSSSLSQDPECVVMLYSDNEDRLTVDVQKNKGKMSTADYVYNLRTGQIGLEIKGAPKDEDDIDDW